MKYGISELSIVPCRAEAADASEMVTQLLFGEHFKVLERRKNWSRIRQAFDGYESWIDNKQYILIDKEDYERYNKASLVSSLELLSVLHNLETGELITIPLGASLPEIENGKLTIQNSTYKFEEQLAYQAQNFDKKNLVAVADMYLNTPYLWGGRSPFGIDCSGFTQLVYKLNGIKIPRDAYQQAELGDPLSFIEEAEPGDLAFFDNAEGKITHVGIILANNHIIHASGKVRVDRIDHQGIYNAETRDYSHKLRILKRIL